MKVNWIEVDVAIEKISKIDFEVTYLPQVDNSWTHFFGNSESEYQVYTKHKSLEFIKLCIVANPLFLLHLTNERKVFIEEDHRNSFRFILLFKLLDGFYGEFPVKQRTKVIEKANKSFV